MQYEKKVLAKPLRYSLIIFYYNAKRSARNTDMIYSIIHPANGRHCIERLKKKKCFNVNMNGNGNTGSDSITK